MSTSTITEESNGAVLVLPWNRWPNYLICVVALIFLVTGIFALKIASGFAADINTFNDAVAATFIGLFGLLFIWVAWCFRTGILPVRFVADATERVCGFRWGRWWNGRFDLAGVDRLVGAVHGGKEKWRWEIRLPADGDSAKGKWIYGPGRTFDSEQAAEQECREVGRRLADHLSLPLDLRTTE